MFTMIKILILAVVLVLFVLIALSAIMVNAREELDEYNKNSGGKTNEQHHN